MRPSPGLASPCIRSGMSAPICGAGRLVPVLPDYLLADSGIYAVMPQRRLVPPRVRAFVDFLAERWAEAPPGGAGWVDGTPAG